MKIAHLDCSTGISGDMTVASLLDCGVDQHALVQAVESLQLPDVRLVVEPTIKSGFRATRIRIEHPEQHAHRHLADIRRIIDGSDVLSASQKSLAVRIFEAIGAAEAHVHGTSIDAVHFHEVGAIDSIVDIVASAVGFDLLGADRVTCSRIPTGRGSVRIAHGICTVPPPATAELLKGVPLCDVPVDAELTTPTGAAIVRTVVDAFGELPAMTITDVGYGAGTMDLPGRANVLRIFVGTPVPAADSDRVVLLETNLDAVTGETIGHTQRRLFDAGALDVFCTAIQMKKNRPGTLLNVLCRPADVENLEQIVFAETETLGIRRHTLERAVRQREECQVETPWGTVRGKRAVAGSGVNTFAPEFDDCARVATAAGVALRDVYRAAESAYQQMPNSGKMPATQDATGSDQDDHRHDHDHSHDHDHDGHRHDHH